MTRVLVDDPLAALSGPSDKEMADLKRAEPAIEAGVHVVNAASALARAEDEHASPNVLESLRRRLWLAKARLAALSGCLPAWGWS